MPGRGVAQQEMSRKGVGGGWIQRPIRDKGKVGSGSKKM